MKSMYVTFFLTLTLAQSALAANCPLSVSINGSSCSVTTFSCAVLEGNTVTVASAGGGAQQCCSGYNDGSGIMCPQSNAQIALEAILESQGQEFDGPRKDLLQDEHLR